MTLPVYGQPPNPGMPQYPQQPQYQPQPPQQWAAPQPQPQYPPQQYAQPMQYQQPQVPLAQGTLSDFFNQPSTGGGPAFSWKGKPVGTTYAGIVTRAITQADIQQQTIPGTTQPAFFRDGRPKFIMKVPMTVQPTAEFPDGIAQWYVAGSARDELTRAMTEAGCDPGSTPEPGAAISIRFASERPSGAGRNPTKIYQVQYSRPNGATPAAVPVPAPQLQAQPQPVPNGGWQPVQVAQPPQPPPPAQPQYVQPQPVAQPQPQYAQPQPVAQPQYAQPQPVQPPPQQPVAGNDLSPEQQELLKQLTGG